MVLRTSKVLAMALLMYNSTRNTPAMLRTSGGVADSVRRVNVESIPEVICNRCLALKPITEFSPDNRWTTRYGRTTYCKPCRRAAYLDRLGADPATRWLVERRERMAIAADVVRAVDAGEIPPPEILCKCCHLMKPITAFVRNKDLPGRYYRQSFCNPCLVVKAKQYRDADPERHRGVVRKGHLKREFGLTLSDYDRMLAEQKYVCAICQNQEVDIHPQTGKVKRLSVDHDARTGHVRGLLCHQCNTGIGKLRHSPKILRAAIAYLKRSDP